MFKKFLSFIKKVSVKIQFKFLIWLIDVRRFLSDKEYKTEMLMSIGDFYYYKYAKENKNLHKNKIKGLAVTHIKDIGFTKIKANRIFNTLTLFVKNPGILIGKRGEDISSLTTWLQNQRKNEKLKILIVEDNKMDALYSFTYDFDEEIGVEDLEYMNKMDELLYNQISNKDTSSHECQCNEQEFLKNQG